MSFLDELSREAEKRANKSVSFEKKEQPIDELKAVIKDEIQIGSYAIYQTDADELVKVFAKIIVDHPPITEDRYQAVRNMIDEMITEKNSGGSDLSLIHI